MDALVGSGGQLVHCRRRSRALSLNGRRACDGRLRSSFGRQSLSSVKITTPATSKHADNGDESQSASARRRRRRCLQLCKCRAVSRMRRDVALTEAVVASSRGSLIVPPSHCRTSSARNRLTASRANSSFAPPASQPPLLFAGGGARRRRPLGWRRVGRPTRPTARQTRTHLHDDVTRPAASDLDRAARPPPPTTKPIGRICRPQPPSLWATLRAMFIQRPQRQSRQLFTFVTFHSSEGPHTNSRLLFPPKSDQISAPFMGARSNIAPMGRFLVPNMADRFSAFVGN